ncbi:tetratricopeptide repeat protein [Clostridia bacterium OttesenSCG-928-O13]|nr:tetratricopeptide repeat protein [Clostridia bacterium OttesenSCG-928-O13]
MKKVISLCLVFALVALCATGCQSETNKVSELLTLGQKYLDNEDFENALATFEQVLEIDPMQVDAYLGMSDAYLGLGEVELAMEILEEGFAATGERRIERRIERMEQGEAEAAAGDNASAPNTSGGDTSLPASVPAATGASRPGDENFPFTFTTHVVEADGATIQLDLPTGLEIEPQNHHIIQRSAILPEDLIAYAMDGSNPNAKIGSVYPVVNPEMLGFVNNTIIYPGDHYFSGETRTLQQEGEPRYNTFFRHGEYLVETHGMFSQTHETGINSTNIYRVGAMPAGQIELWGVMSFYHNENSVGTRALLERIIDSFVITYT